MSEGFNLQCKERRPGYGYVNWPEAGKLYVKSGGPARPTKARAEPEIRKQNLPRVLQLRGLWCPAD